MEIKKKLSATLVIIVCVVVCGLFAYAAYVTRDPMYLCPNGVVLIVGPIILNAVSSHCEIP